MICYYDIQDGNYIWHTSLDRAHNMGSTIAVLFDKKTGVLLHHGIASIVNMQYNKLRSAFDVIGDANDLVILNGKVPIEKLNRAIASSGICHKVFSEEIDSLLALNGVE